MLHTDDRALVEGDLALRGLDLILDEHRLCAELDAVLPAQVAGLEVISVRYKPGMSCLVGLSLVIDGVRTRASAQLFGPNQRDKFQKYCEQAEQSPIRPAGIHVLPGAAIIVWLWPFDGELAALSALGDPARRGRLIESCLGEAVSVDSLRLETLRYKPQRRWTARVIDRDRSCALIKVSTHDRFDRTLHAAKRAHAISALGAPRVIGSSQRRGAIGLAWIPGEQLGERLLTGSVRNTDLHNTGSVLAELHRVGIRSAWKLSKCSIKSRLRVARRAIAALEPTHDSVVEQITRSVSEDLANLPRAIIHGDCSADQVLINDNNASLIDWDRMAVGPGVVDLGRFAATLNLADLTEHTAAAQDIMKPIIEAYHEKSSSDPRPHMPAATTLALLELACEPFRRRVSGWHDLLGRVVRKSSDLCGMPTHGA